MNVTGTEVDILAKVMDASVRRHEVAAANLANVNTPNFKAKEVRFEEAFREAMKRDDDAALEVEPEVVESEGAVVKVNGNSVSMERELGLIHKNSLAFQVYNTMLRQKLSTLRAAISGSGR
jgi:flagellar basal-body rod protein FlgB